MKHYREINLKGFLVVTLVLIAMILFSGCSCDAKPGTSNDTSSGSNKGLEISGTTQGNTGEGSTTIGNEQGDSSGNGAVVSEPDGDSGIDLTSRPTQEAQYDGHLTYADDKIAVIDGIEYSVHNLPEAYYYGECPYGSGNWIVVKVL